MKKRLRKKLRVKEFQEFGFSIEGQVIEFPNEAEFYEFYDRFIEFIESFGLLFGGRFGTNIDGFMCRCDYRYCGYNHTRRRSCNEDDRQKVIEWLASSPEVKTFIVGELEDAWKA